MKKILIILICLLLLVGCKKEEDKKVSEPLVEEKFVLKKTNEEKDIVYFNNYKEVLVSGDSYVYKYPVVNIVGEEIDNLNLELKNFVIKSYKKSGIYENNLNSGNVIEYETYVNDDYISIIQKYYYYIDGMVGEMENNVYVISLNSGKIINKEKILEDYEMTQDDILNKVKEKVETDDIQFTIMNIKTNGYELYVNNDKELCIIYYEVTNEEEIRKELVLN